MIKILKLKGVFFSGVFFGLTLNALNALKTPPSPKQEDPEIQIPEGLVISHARFRSNDQVIHHYLHLVSTGE